MFWMLLFIFQYCSPSFDPSASIIVIPEATSDNVLDDVMGSKLGACITAGSLTITVNRSQPEDTIEALISLCGKQDWWPKSSDVGSKVHKKMEL